MRAEFVSDTIAGEMKWSKRRRRWTETDWLSFFLRTLVEKPANLIHFEFFSLLFSLIFLISFLLLVKGSSFFFQFLHLKRIILLCGILRS